MLHLDFSSQNLEPSVTDSNLDDSSDVSRDADLSTPSFDICVAES